MLDIEQLYIDGFTANADAAILKVRPGSKKTWVQENSGLRIFASNLSQNKKMT